MSSSSNTSGLEAARPRSLAGMVDIAEDAIVSRVLMKNSAGSVTLFAFDEGQFLSEHTAPFDALVQLLDGSMTVTIGGEDSLLDGGDAVLMPADVPHALKATTSCRMLLVMLRERGSEG